MSASREHRRMRLPHRRHLFLKRFYVMFFIELATRRVRASEDMLGLLEKDGPLGVGEKSPFRNGLRRAGRWTDADTLHSKLGLIRPDRNRDSPPHRADCRRQPHDQ